MRLLTRTARKLLPKSRIFAICVAAALNVYASGLSQTVTFSGKDVPLKKLFSVIRQQTGYSVFYNKKLLEHSRPVTVEARDMPLKEFLNKALVNQPLGFRIDEKTIILSEKPVEKPAAKQVTYEPLKTTEQRQDRIVTGRVTDEKGGGLGGATVMVKGSTQSVQTKEDGTFSIKVPEGSAVLVITYVGMLNQEVSVGGRAVVSVSMAAKAANMDDVVVVGYGSQKKNQTTGAIASIKASEIQDIPAPNIAGALRGRIAGLGVSSASGRPGASITLNIRNAQANALAGGTAEPLYVIDNIIVGKSDFDNLDPSMVEDISILKDASAAIYGAAGAKGVVLITTKRGKAGAPKLSYNGYLGVSDATRKPEMLSAYDHAVLLNDTYRMNNQDVKNFFTEADLQYIKGLNNKSWFDELWQPALTQRHNLSLSGGSDRMTFFAGGSYQNENANYAGMKQDKYSFRSGLTTKVAKSLKADIGFNVDQRVLFSKNGTSENDQAFLEKLIQVPLWVPTSINGHWVNDNSVNSHPLGQIASGYYRSSKSGGYRINANLMYQPEAGALKGLTARLQVSQGGSSGTSDEYRPAYWIYKFNRISNNGLLYGDSLTKDSVLVNAGDNSRLSRGLSRSNSWQGTFTLQYARTFGRHSINAIAGAEQSASRGDEAGWLGLNPQVPGFDAYWAFNEAPTQPFPTISESTKRSFFSRFSYNYDNKYTVEGITRFDASSNFVNKNIWGISPSVGLGWVVSQEDFFHDAVPFVSYLKLRANFGLTGDDRVSSRLWQERFRVDAVGTLYGETLVPGLKQQIIPNPDITWEKKRTLNGGVDVALFQNKLNLTADFFQDYIYDAFDKGNDANFPYFAGFKAPIVNYQQRHSWGSEFSIGYQARLARELQLKASINFGFANGVTDRMFYNRYLLWENSPEDWIYNLGTDPRKYNSNNFGLVTEGMFRTQAEVDAFLSKNPNYTIDGKVPQPGWLYFKDANGDGIITDRDRTLMFDRVDARLSTGSQLGLIYKSFALNVNVAARFGGKEFYDSKARRSAPTAAKNVPAFWTDRWTPENPAGRFPRTDDPSIVSGWESTFWAVDGTMVRVNDMTVSYKVPSHIIRRIGLDNARILATGNNLWVLKNPLKYKDPYSSYIYDYPTLRTLSVGLSLGF
ncbi:TonB-dependent receptor [Paraflavisolibacter sp. H34]|uniref:TonB-dependent receptor n=1 Tax=Huijunlia imazamoxiresistens TaxID=3127457 RepID=UPI00301B3964